VTVERVSDHVSRIPVPLPMRDLNDYFWKARLVDAAGSEN